MVAFAMADYIYDNQRVIFLPENPMNLFPPIDVLHV